MTGHKFDCCSQNRQIWRVNVYPKSLLSDVARFDKTTPYVGDTCPEVDCSKIRTVMEGKDHKGSISTRCSKLVDDF